MARRSEAVFARGALLNLPMAVFAGAVALNFGALLMGIDSVTYVRDDGATKQIGFHSAPNWTLLFMVFLPLFFLFTVDLLKFWKTQGRAILMTSTGRSGIRQGWRARVERSSATYWSVFLICFLFAGVFQWTSLRLLPLMGRAEADDIDWGFVAIVRPDVVTPIEGAVFAAFAYLYMSLCFYLMVGGLILIWTVVHDLWEKRKTADRHGISQTDAETDAVALRVMRGVFRCSAAGLMIASCMKVQSLSLPTGSATAWSWLIADARFDPSTIAWPQGHAIQMHWTSLLVAMPVGFSFLYAFIRIGRHGPLLKPSGRMLAAFSLIGAAYLLVGEFPGFALLLGVATIVALYGLVDPSYGSDGNPALEDRRSVP